jgi:hypothetical protein
MSKVKTLAFWVFVAIATAIALIVFLAILLVAGQSLYEPPREEYSRAMMDRELAYESLHTSRWLSDVLDSNLVVYNFDSYNAWALLKVDPQALLADLNSRQRDRRVSVNDVSENNVNSHPRDKRMPVEAGHTRKALFRMLTQCIRRSHPGIDQATEVQFLSASSEGRPSAAALFYFPEDDRVLYARCM